MHAWRVAYEEEIIRIKKGHACKGKKNKEKEE